MPRPHPERRLETALAALGRALTATRAPWMLIGGLAVIAHGVRRLTTDVDATIRGDAVLLPRLLEALAREDIQPRIPDASAFAEANLVLLAQHVATGVDLDISLAWSSFELAALSSRTRARFGRVAVPMATARDLVVYKALAARPKDLEDAEALLALHPDLDLRGIRRDVAALADLAGEPSIVRGLDRIIRRARPTPKAAAPRRRKR